MPKWRCSDCDRVERVDSTDEVNHYCKDCGGRLSPDIDPQSLADADTQTDKI
jgi:rRNA maturation endonuclease Nob1